MHKHIPCYTEYAGQRHAPASKGPYKLPFQRPPKHERTYYSAGVEDVINSMTSRMRDKDLARMFENCFPNTVDTTVKWFYDSNEGPREGPYSFVTAGDMDAAWLRDNLWQIKAYESLLPCDLAIQKLWQGVINFFSCYLAQAPYTNSFQPPKGSGLECVSDHVVSMSDDVVHPPIDPTLSFEGKYALDSLTAFLCMTNIYVQQTNDTSFLHSQWYRALKAVLKVLDEQSQSTFDESGRLPKPAYSFERPTTISSESVYNGPDQPPNSGTGNPVKRCGLVKSAFRASDDATIFPYHIPANAMLEVELKRTAEHIRTSAPILATKCLSISQRIAEAIHTYGTTTHPVFGKVFAYEVDGYGSQLLMDDASPPSLLSLPYLGFVEASDTMYQNTRRMVLCKEGNPYYVVGDELEGQGSPHIDLRTMWPIGTIMQIQTSSNDEEILRCLAILKKSSTFGLMHEGVNVNDATKFLRTWYAWGNSAFGEMILDLSKRKPHLLFG